jgi:hypothetical protein
LTWQERLGLWANIPKMEARELLREVKAAGTPMSYEMAYDLVLAATEDRDAAERTARAILHSELKAALD